MLYGFYFRIYRSLHNEKISIILARICYFLYVCLFCIKKIFLKKRIVSMDAHTAMDIVSRVYPMPDYPEPIYKDAGVDEGLDLSIIIPVYNYADLIGQNIESVINQKTKYKFEAIFVDDGSTDGARDILKKYENHPNVKLIFQENTGIAGARNTGLNSAKGKYIMFIDCDDTIHDDLVETLMSRAYEDNCDIAMCAHNLVKQRGGEIYETVPNIYPNEKFMGLQKRDGILNYVGLPWCKVYKRELFEGVRYLPGYWYEDTIIQWLLFTRCEKFSYIPKIGYEYRWYENNFSHVQNNKARNPKSIDRYWMLLKIIDKYEELKLPKDIKFYKLLLTHLSIYYYPSIMGLESETVEALFVLANELLVKYKPDCSYRLPYMLRTIEKAILTKNINLWKLAIRYN